jgi:hypothetical protein
MKIRGTLPPGDVEAFAPKSVPNSWGTLHKGGKQDGKKEHCDQWHYKNSAHINAGNPPRFFPVGGYDANAAAKQQKDHSKKPLVKWSDAQQHAQWDRRVRTEDSEAELADFQMMMNGGGGGGGGKQHQEQQQQQQQQQQPLPLGMTGRGGSGGTLDEWMASAESPLALNSFRAGTAKLLAQGTAGSQQQARAARYSYGVQQQQQQPASSSSNNNNNSGAGTPPAQQPQSLSKPSAANASSMSTSMSRDVGGYCEPASPMRMVGTGKAAVATSSSSASPPLSLAAQYPSLVYESASLYSNGQVAGGGGANRQGGGIATVPLLGGGSMREDDGNRHLYSTHSSSSSSSGPNDNGSHYHHTAGRVHSLRRLVTHDPEARPSSSTVVTNQLLFPERLHPEGPWVRPASEAKSLRIAAAMSAPSPISSSSSSAMAPSPQAAAAAAAAAQTPTSLSKGSEAASPESLSAVAAPSPASSTSSTSHHKGGWGKKKTSGSSGTVLAAENREYLPAHLKALTNEIQVRKAQKEARSKEVVEATLRRKEALETAVDARHKVMQTTSMNDFGTVSDAVPFILDERPMPPEAEAHMGAATTTMGLSLSSSRPPSTSAPRAKTASSAVRPGQPGMGPGTRGMYAFTRQEPSQVIPSVKFKPNVGRVATRGMSLKITPGVRSRMTYTSKEINDRSLHTQKKIWVE